MIFVVYKHISRDFYRYLSIATSLEGLFPLYCLEEGGILQYHNVTTIGVQLVFCCLASVSAVACCTEAAVDSFNRATSCLLFELLFSGPWTSSPVAAN